MKKSWLYWVVTLFIICIAFSCSPKKKDDPVKKANAFKELGVAYMKDDMDAAAYKNLRKAESLNPNDPHIHFALGVFYFKKENYRQAIAEYKRCLELKPDFASVYNNIGLTYFELGEYDTAIANFKKLIGNYVYATPHYPLLNIGRSYYHKGDYQEAIRYFQKTIDVEPEFAPAILWLGRTYIEVGNSRQAIETLQRGIRVAPKYADMQTPSKRRGPRYTPLSRRQNRPDAIAWLVRNHPELSDAQISKLIGTTKTTIGAVRDRTHWNSANIKPTDPVSLGLCTQIDLDEQVKKAVTQKKPAAAPAKSAPAEKQTVASPSKKRRAAAPKTAKKSVPTTPSQASTPKPSAPSATPAAAQQTSVEKERTAEKQVPAKTDASGAAEPKQTP